MSTPPPSTSTRERLVAAAFTLYTAQGFENTTVDQIAATAGVGRATYFRHFPTKEAVVFPDHDSLLGQVDARLGAARDQPEGATEGPAWGQIGTALHEAAAIVLRHYLAEDELARQRYRLTRSVAGLRDTELAGQFRYQQMFRRHLLRWFPQTQDALLAEVLANAVVTAHNHVLRDWLRDATTTPTADLAAALAQVTRRLLPRNAVSSRGHDSANSRAASASRVLVFDSSLTPLQVQALLRDAE